ncbi:hypothetical protein NQZ68_003524 [Dissostichus eleginoides]|nr:hypothetical protein NQZ68_003524 [Dissostichus eleginoides]
MQFVWIPAPLPIKDTIALLIILLHCHELFSMASRVASPTTTHQRMEPASTSVSSTPLLLSVKGAFRSLAASLLAVPGVFKPVADKRSSQMSHGSVTVGWISTA